MFRLRSLLWCTALFTGLCAARQFGDFPLAFEPNQGQTDPRVRYLARSGNMVVFLTGDGYTLSTGGRSVSMRVAGAVADPRLSAERPVEGISNYFVSGRAITGVPHFERVRTERIRPGVDAIFYGRESQVEYDFIVAPGADPRSITLHFTGAGRPAIDANGDLVLRSGEVEFRHHKPIAWQGSESARSPVECAYSVLPNGDVRFKMGTYDPREPVTIDPVLSYSTYVSGSGVDLPYGIAVDSAGSAYITGATNSTDYPVTSGASAGGYDVFVSKLNATGTGLVYSTYIGGSGMDIGYGIAVDSNGNAYVTGNTTSTALAPNYQGAGDAFVLKLGPSGALLWTVGIGGIGQDVGYGVAVDASGSVYVAGVTGAGSSIATTGAAQTTVRGAADGFVAKLSSSGATSYVTYVGGGDTDGAWAIAVDSAGNAYVTGQTYSSDFPVTSDATQSAFGGNNDAFLVVLNASGTSRLFSTYLGGSGQDWPRGIALDSNGGVYVAGTTVSTNFPTTAGVVASTKPATDPTVNSGFVAKFVHSTAWSLSYSTYFGGPLHVPYVNGVAVDSSGRAVVVGSTPDAGYPTTADALKRVKTVTNETNIFLTQLAPDGKSIVYSTLFGGSNAQTAAGVAIDSRGAAYVVGTTAASDYPTTPGAFQPGPRQNGGQVVLKINLSQTPVTHVPGDFNGDGVPDLVWQNDATRQVTVNYYGGTGGASYQGYNWLYTSSAPGWRIAAIADFNGDGVPDLVWQNEATGQASVHYYGGTGGAVDQGWAWLYPGNAVGWKIIAAADFNGDGTPDLVWQNEATRQVTVHYYGGTGGAVNQGWAWLYGASAPGWRVVAVADFNGDGVPDLVWQGETSRQVSVHYYGGTNGAVDQGWAWLNSSGASGWKVTAAADFNSDGVPDLVWMNDTTRQVTVHYYGGTGGSVYQGWNWLNSTGAAGWSVVR